MTTTQSTDSQRFLDRLNLDRSERNSLLDQLDVTTQPVEPNRRSEARLRYRGADIPIVLRHLGHTTGRFRVATRNISASGLSILHGGYVPARQPLRSGSERP